MNRKKHKYQYINGTKGVISLFLCIVISPFLTIASALLEFSRYQGAAETVEEMMDCASFSTIADYDVYLQERFGLFAVSQEHDISGGYQEALQEMASLTGKAVQFDSASAKGKIPLSKSYAMRSQLMDFGENTVLTEVLLDDLKLEEIIEKLKQLDGLSKVADAVNEVANVAESLTGIVEKGEALKNILSDVAGNFSSVQSNLEVLKVSISSLCEKLSKNFTYDAAKEEESLKALVDTYAEDIASVYGNAQNLYQSLKELCDSAEGLPAAAQELKQALEEVKGSLPKIKESTKEAADAVEETAKKTEENAQGAEGTSEDGKTNLVDTAAETADVFGTIVDALNEACTEATEKLKTDMVEHLKTAAADLEGELTNAFHLDMYSSDYFSQPLSSMAQEDLKKILAIVPEAWGEGSAEHVIQQVMSVWLPGAVNVFSFNETIASVKGAIETAITNVKDKLQENVNNSLSDILSSLIAAVEGIFSLDLFYNPRLNATLNAETCGVLLEGGTGSDPLQDLLNAIATIKTASEEFARTVGSLDYVGAVRALATLLRAVAGVFRSLVSMAGNVVSKIGEMAGYLVDGNKTSLYDLLLMSAYMTHNLPNRTNTKATGAEVDIGAGISFSTELEGSALTGYAYDDIVSSDGAMFKGAELEYILGGSNDEKANQSFSFMEIYMLRFLLNVAVVLTDTDVAAMAAAATVASWVVYLLVMLGEPMVDTLFLVNGESVFLVKNGCYLSPTGIPGLGQKLIEIAVSNGGVADALNEKWSQIQTDKLPKGTKPRDLDKGIFKMGYKEHMLLTLMLSVKEDDILRRFANIVQLESNSYYQKNGGNAFNIKKAYTCIQTETKVEYKSLINVFQFHDASIMKKTYTRMKGY